MVFLWKYGEEGSALDAVFSPIYRFSDVFRSMAMSAVCSMIGVFVMRHIHLRRLNFLWPLSGVFCGFSSCCDPGLAMVIVEFLHLRRRRSVW